MLVPVHLLEQGLTRRHIGLEFVYSLLTAKRFFSECACFYMYPLTANQNYICSTLINARSFVLKLSQDIGDYLSLRLRPKLNHFYPMQFENLLADDEKKILLDEPLTRSDCTFLQSFYGAALPDQHSFDFTKVEKA